MVVPIYQLNTPHCTVPADAAQGGTCGGDDCVLCCMIMGIDFATHGEVIVNQKELRGLPTVPNSGGLFLQDIKDGIAGFAGRFHKNGYEIPVVEIHDNGAWTSFVDETRNPEVWVIAFWNNAIWSAICTDNASKALSGDLEFKGSHAVCARSFKHTGEKGNKSGHSQIKIWNPLWDGRIDHPSGVRVVAGPQRVPAEWVKRALLGRTHTIDKVDYAVIHRAVKIADPTNPDDCLRPIRPQRTKTGTSSEGAK